MRPVWSVVMLAVALISDASQVGRILFNGEKVG